MVGTLGAWAAAAPAAHAAGTPCDDTTTFSHTVSIVPNELELAYAQGDPYDGVNMFTRAALCTSTAVGTQDVVVQGQPWGTGGPAYCNPNGNPNEYTGGGEWAFSTGVGINGAVGEGAAPQLCQQPDGTYTLVLSGGACVGAACQASPTEAVNKTGVIVGTLTKVPAPAGGTSEAYAVQSFCVYVDGIALTNCATGLPTSGVVTTGAPPVTTTAASTPGPCALGICVPYGSAGTTGSQLATLYVAGIPVNVYGVHTCVYQQSAATPCAY
jgi:hypothetical protein